MDQEKYNGKVCYRKWASILGENCKRQGTIENILNSKDVKICTVHKRVFVKNKIRKMAQSQEPEV